MRIPPKPRYQRTKVYANQFLLRYKLSKLPIDPYQIIKDNKWALTTYGQLEQENNCPRRILKQIYEDGFTEFNGRNYSIAYDEKIRSLGRIRLTLMHEIGHIYLNHFVDFKQTSISKGFLSDDEYAVLESEAYYFAKNILAPLTVLDKLQIKTSSMIYRITGLSSEASGYRLDDLNKWKSTHKNNNYDFAVLSLFHNFIHKKYCVICGHSFVIEDAKYCPVCGKRRIYWGDGKMKYKDIESSNGKVKICLKCQNESVFLENKELQYCKICGAPIVNKCAGQYERDRDGEIYYTVNPCDDIIQDGNARFCAKCGSPTRFGLTELLKPWEEELKELEKEVSNSSFKQVAATQKHERDIPI